ncbi:uncharacterized protein LOC121375009 isoform X2 [Gigantopelta aegis]|uniref:uncharacterized protein LOC121375009 isoform X2 n=1 Tax=Gigantopelta aegis TaxID=1735272 RepID=UPI001B88E4F7|nr:uncharacterized protein LOC121375009 isoform X2 [Gigantopelta aegis]
MTTIVYNVTQEYGLMTTMNKMNEDEYSFRMFRVFYDHNFKTRKMILRELMEQPSRLPNRIPNDMKTRSKLQAPKQVLNKSAPVLGCCQGEVKNQSNLQTAEKHSKSVPEFATSRFSKLHVTNRMVPKQELAETVSKMNEDEYHFHMFRMAYDKKFETRKMMLSQLMKQPLQHNTMTRSERAPKQVFNKSAPDLGRCQGEVKRKPHQTAEKHSKSVPQFPTQSIPKQTKRMAAMEWFDLASSVNDDGKVDETTGMYLTHRRHIWKPEEKTKGVMSTHKIDDKQPESSDKPEEKTKGVMSTRKIDDKQRESSDREPWHSVSASSSTDNTQRRSRLFEWFDLAASGSDDGEVDETTGMYLTHRKHFWKVPELPANLLEPFSPSSSEEDLLANRKQPQDCTSMDNVLHRSTKMIPLEGLDTIDLTTSSEEEIEDNDPRPYAKVAGIKHYFDF